MGITHNGLRIYTTLPWGDIRNNTGSTGCSVKTVNQTFTWNIHAGNNT